MHTSGRIMLFAALLISAGMVAESLGAQREGRARLLRFANIQPESLPAPEVAPAPPSLPMQGTPQKYLGPVLQPKYLVSYKHHHTLRRTCCRCCRPQKIILEVPDPCCTSVAVPVTIPGCCHGDPYVSTGRDVLGRYSYTYQWRTGYKIDVVFRPHARDIVVHTWGR